jgi:hypothetical protein
MPVNIEKKREKDREYRRRIRSTEEGAEKNRVTALAAMNRMKAVGREISIPEVVNPERKESCRHSLWDFANTYFPHYTYLKPASYHPEIYADLQAAILYGRSQAIAAPRGGAKDTIFTIAVIWAIAYGHKKWLVYGAATMANAKKKVENIKNELENSQLLFEDFPEMCQPIRALERSPLRCKSQRIKSKDGDAYFSQIVWSQDEVVLATVEGADCSGAVITPVGLEGAARGMVKGEQRPDFLVINDGETDEAARSEVMRKKIEKTIDQSLSGLPGPGKSIAKFFLCTIVCPGCISEKYTDPSQKPGWNGKRYSMMLKFPDREDMWVEYMKLWQEGKASGKDPDARIAHAFYVANQQLMDAGAQMSWEDRYIRDIVEDGSQAEISALQHAYNLRVENGETAFFSEYQNNPLPENLNTIGLTSALVASRCSGYNQDIVPAHCTHITRGLDVGARTIHSVTKAWLPTGDSFVVDYSRIEVEAPPGDLRNPRGGVRVALEAAVLSALRIARSVAEDMPLTDSDGNKRYVDLTLVDSGFLEKVVYTFCNESGPRYRPIKGYGSKQGQKRYAPPQQKQKLKKPLHKCYVSKLSTGQLLWHVDADYWKLFCQMRFLQDPETNGACSIFGMDPTKHRTYGNHIVSELFDPETQKWEEQNKHNHFLDGTAYADCAAGMLGIRIVSLAAAPEKDDGTPVAPKVIPRPGDKKRPKIPTPTQAKGGARVVKRRETGW